MVAGHERALGCRCAISPAVVRYGFQIILVGNIDYTGAARHAEVMAPHHSVQRRSVDLLFVASAACPIRRA